MKLHGFKIGNPHYKKSLKILYKNHNKIIQHGKGNK